LTTTALADATFANALRFFRIREDSGGAGDGSDDGSSDDGESESNDDDGGKGPEPEAAAAASGRGIVGMLVEGGAELAGTALAARLVHRLHAFVAPILLGPRGRPGAVDWAGPDTPQTAPRILDPKWELLGSDAHVSGPLVFPDE
jgi:hypothetical protein